MRHGRPSPDIVQRLRKDFTGVDRTDAVDVIGSMRSDWRVERVVIFLAAGSLARLRSVVSAARPDTRDVLYWPGRQVDRKPCRKPPADAG